jgi:flavin reductase (DIM6/NTAB) family NADH-FMN oxidoreductase RutF
VAYRISQILHPRLTVLITTCDRSGKPDVATFSFFMPVSFEPKYVAFAVAPQRLTFANLQEVKEFVVNVPTAGMLSEVWVCGSVSGREADKFKLAGLTPVPSEKVKPPRIKECPVQLECVVEWMGEFGDHWLVVGKAVAEHVEKTRLRTTPALFGQEVFQTGREARSGLKRA